MAVFILTEEKVDENRTLLGHYILYNNNNNNNNAMRVSRSSLNGM
jgi:hypothetical protein